MFDYARREEYGVALKCDSCGCAAPTSDFNWPPGTQPNWRPKRALCEFCSTTMASRYTEYPALDQQDWLRAEVWRAAASVFNMLKHGGRNG